MTIWILAYKNTLIIIFVILYICLYIYILYISNSWHVDRTDTVWKTWAWTLRTLGSMKCWSVCKKVCIKHGEKYISVCEIHHKESKHWSYNVCDNTKHLHFNDEEIPCCINGAFMSWWNDHNYQFPTCKTCSCFCQTRKLQLTI